MHIKSPRLLFIVSVSTVCAAAAGDRCVLPAPQSVSAGNAEATD